MFVTILNCLLFAAALILLLVYFLLYTDLLWGRKIKTYVMDDTFEKHRVGELPHSFPRGWYCIAQSNQLKSGQVQEVTALGRKFVLFRDENSELGALDPYCPHLGTNLSDGHVDGDLLVCPFHGWKFDKQGYCREIPYSTQKKDGRVTNSWFLEECYGGIYLWYDPDNTDPSWNIADELIFLKKLCLRNKRQKKLHIHMQDFFENGADYPHFNTVHKHLSIPLIGKYFELEHHTKINFGSASDNKRHTAYFENKVFVKKSKGEGVHKESEGIGRVTFLGPSIMVFNIETRIAKATIIKTFLPQTNLNVDMLDFLYASKSEFGPFVQLVAKEACQQFEDDIKIWERKRYLKQPMLVKGDGPIMRFRKWYQQFYK